MNARFLLLFSILAAPVAAQNVRDPVLVAQPDQLSSGPVAATQGDLTAVVYVDAVDGGVHLVAGDGRGLSWEAPVRVDDASSQAFRQVGPGAVAVVGDAIYVWWLDQRLHPGTDELYCNVSRDGGRTFQPADLRVDKGLPGGGNNVLAVRMLVDPRRRQDPADDLVVFLLAVQNQETGLDEAWLNWSTDGGASFQPTAIPLGTHNGFGDLDALAGAIQDGLCWIARVDDYDTSDANDDVWLDVFDPVTGTFLASDRPLSDTSSLLAVGSEVAVGVQDKLVAVAWPVHNLGTGTGELRVNVSTDAGTTWQGERTASDPLASIGSLQDVHLALASGGVILAAWRDDRSGRTEAWLTRSPDQGSTWEADLGLSSGGASAVDLLAPSTIAGVFWLEGGGNAALRAQMSLDAGATWLDPVAVAPTGVRATGAAWNRIYHNFLAFWAADDPAPGSLQAGGFRPQTLVPGGAWLRNAATGTSGTGQTLDGISVANWPEPERGGYFTILLSASPGDTLLPDGRNVGLAPDPWLAWSRVPVLGANTGRIHADGTGDVLDVLPILEGLPGPVWAVAVGWTTSIAKPGAITDPMSLELP